MTALSKLIAIFEEDREVKLPKHKIVCPRCEGKGTHVNPAIDGNGITSDEWNEWDDDEREGYLTGRYDVRCEECGGNNVVDEIDEDRMAPELLADWHRYLADDAETEAIYRMERMMGA